VCVCIYTYTHTHTHTYIYIYTYVHDNDRRMERNVYLAISDYAQSIFVFFGMERKFYAKA